MRTQLCSQALPLLITCPSRKTLCQTPCTCMASRNSTSKCSSQIFKRLTTPYKLIRKNHNDIMTNDSGLFCQLKHSCSVCAIIDDIHVHVHVHVHVDMSCVYIIYGATFLGMCTVLVLICYIYTLLETWRSGDQG